MGRLVKHRGDASPYIEVFLEGESHWKGIPTFGSATGCLACGGQGVSSVPDASRDGLRQFLANMPLPEANSTTNAGSAAEGTFEYKDNDGERVRLMKHFDASPP